MSNLFEEHGELIVSGIISILLIAIIIGVMYGVSNMYAYSLESIVGV